MNRNWSSSFFFLSFAPFRSSFNCENFDIIKDIRKRKKNGALALPIKQWPPSTQHGGEFGWPPAAAAAAQKYKINPIGCCCCCCLELIRCEWLKKKEKEILYYIFNVIFFQGNTILCVCVCSFVLDGWWSDVVVWFLFSMLPPFIFDLLNDISSLKKSVSTIKATTSSGKEREVTHFSSSAKDGWVDSFQFKEKKNIFNEWEQKMKLFQQICTKRRRNIFNESE